MVLDSCTAGSWVAACLENVSYLWGGEALTHSSARAVERDGDALVERSK